MLQWEGLLASRHIEAGVDQSALRSKAAYMLMSKRGGLPLQRIEFFPAWERATPVLKTTFANVAMLLGNGALASTVRLGADRIARASEARVGFQQHLSKELGRRLREALRGTADYWFVIEGGARGSGLEGTHLHGVVHAADNEQRVAVRGALRLVATDFNPATAVRTRPLADVRLWTDYAMKSYRQTERLIGAQPLIMSQRLRQAARAQYAAHRAAYGLAVTEARREAGEDR